MPAVVRRYRLAEGPDARGLSCDATGLHLAGAPLLQTTPVGFEPRADREIQALIAIAYLGAEDGARLLPGLQVVAKALNEGQFAKAMIAAVFLRLPDLDEAGARHVAETDILLRQYNPAELRDWRGWWTTGGDDDPNAEHFEEIADRTQFHDLVVEILADKARRKGFIVQTKVSLTTVDGVTAEADIILKDPSTGQLVIVEVKTGNSRLSEFQRYVYPIAMFGNHVFSLDQKIQAFGYQLGEPLPSMWALKVTKFDFRSDYNWSWMSPRDPEFSGVKPLGRKL